MGATGKWFLGAVLFLGLAPAMVWAAEGPADGAKGAVAQASEGLRFSGSVWADYYWVAAQHEGALNGSAGQNGLNGVWFRRILLSGDDDFGNGFSSRLRLEMDGADFQAPTGTALVTPFVKEAWIRYAFQQGPSLAFGQVESASIGYLERQWGYRSVERTPLDLQGWASSIDQGLSLEGSLGDLGYQVVAGNGTGPDSQGIDNGKNVELALSAALPAGLSVWTYGDLKAAHDGFVGPDAYTYTLQGFLGWKAEAGRVGLLYARQVLADPATAGETVKELLSAYAVARVWGQASAYVRVDHLLWGTLDRGGEAYLDLARQRSTLGIVGLDYPLTPALKLQPNVEMAYYQNDAGGAVASQDVIPRLTVAWDF